MEAYLNIVRNVLTKGKWKKPVRRNSDGTETILANDTLALPNQVFSHNMSDGFPLLTTKKMPLKTIAIELEGFIKGITTKKWYQDRGCKIWNEWANPKTVKERQYKSFSKGQGFDAVASDKNRDNELTKQFQLEEDDLGPIYGYQWRSFNKTYYNQDENDGDFHNYTDQLKVIVDTLHKNPYDRRMVCSAWNPNQIDMMALPPCHYAWNVTVIDDEINLFWAQRSCDLMLGVPFNIASYALLLMLLAKESGFKPGNLSGMLVDCHIYSNHIEGANVQLSREPRELPQLEVLSEQEFSIFNWTHKDLKLTNYNPHDKISFGEVTV